MLAFSCAEAAVHVGERQVAAIGQGMLVLVGIEKHDLFEDSSWAANKLVKLKLWEGPERKPWQKSAIHNEHQILLVSQVCLHAYIWSSVTLYLRGQVSNSRCDTHNDM